ncbi:hypothetical protein ADIMK_1260 [Marinobacterium lacunae]|uniref:Uncharacterized protein n=1 Tax=Marinobacterium lacunae TaxID=1232683 RepID=A0A081G202_9GAMM|nr:hypothetical protein ADIMK_1260 [Marinobacterium lacunae]
MLLVTLGGLFGCAGPQYWHEPPGAAQSSAESEVWQGIARNTTVRYISVSPLTQVSVRCASYEDLIRLERKGSTLDVQLGRDPVLDLNIPVGQDGRFSTVVPVEGDTWVYGGVMLIDESPVLHLWGQLDDDSGIGVGRINVSPGDERLGCPGRFQVSRNGGPPAESELGSPFRVQYWIDELDSNDDHLILGGWPFRRH